MNERTPSGQFAEPAFGQAGLERDAGWVPMPDHRKKDDAREELTVREAARELTKERAEAPEETIREVYTDAEGNPAPRNETLTIERAADDMRESRAARAEVAAKEADAALLAELGIDLEEKPAAKEVAEEQPEPTSKPPSASKEGELDPELERALNHPQVQEALKAQIAENETARQQYRNGLDAAVQIAQVAFISQFPEFANTTPDQHPRIAAAIAQQNPGRWAAIQAAVANSSRLFEAQRFEHQQTTEREAAEFKTYAAEQDKAFDEFAKGIPPAQQQELIREIFAGAKEYGGIEAPEFARMFATDRTLRNAAFQRMMMDAAAYRKMMRATKAQATREVPHVMRPGAAPPLTNAASRSLQALKTKFNQNPTIRNAAALRAAERKARG